MNPNPNSHDDHRTPTLRPAPAITPAARLVIAILHQAAHDYKRGDPTAHEFIRSADFDRWCDLINANPDYLRHRITRDLQPRRRPEIHP